MQFDLVLRVAVLVVREVEEPDAGDGHLVADLKVLGDEAGSLIAVPSRACTAAWLSKAGDEARTRDPQLGKLMLYQLSYSRVPAQDIDLAARLERGGSPPAAPLPGSFR
jgi:hypothetical protein